MVLFLEKEQFVPTNFLPYKSKFEINFKETKMNEQTNTFLPINRIEMNERGWDRPDFVYVTGDAYVDHPSFGVSIISRVLEAEGFRVAILSQPDYKSAEPF